MCRFDLVANNADRKSGHCLLGADGAIYGIDNGLCFHVEPKLRTVIWDFGGEPIRPRCWRTSGASPARSSRRRSPALLDQDEQKALRARASALAPAPAASRSTPAATSYPWPLV